MHKRVHLLNIISHLLFCIIDKRIKIYKPSTLTLKSNQIKEKGEGSIVMATAYKGKTAHTKIKNEIKYEITNMTCSLYLKFNPLQHYLSRDISFET